MCTVSVIGQEDMLRVVVNRDELRTRPIALPPRIVQCGDRNVLMPIDPTSGGTWVAVNDAGLVFVMLNRNPAAATSQPIASGPSRGTIIPAIADAQNIIAAAGAVEALDLTSIAPFRLLIIGRVTMFEMLWESQRLSLRRHRLGRPIMFTSSGLGDAMVEPPRQELFQRMLDGHGSSAAKQDAFHAHHWPERGDISVCMSRADAQTVSRTVVQRTRDEAVMCYTPITGAPRRGDRSSTRSLSLARLMPCHSH